MQDVGIKVYVDNVIKYGIPYLFSKDLLEETTINCMEDLKKMEKFFQDTFSPCIERLILSEVKVGLPSGRIANVIG